MISRQPCSLLWYAALVLCLGWTSVVALDNGAPHCPLLRPLLMLLGWLAVCGCTQA